MKKLILAAALVAGTTAAASAADLPAKAPVLAPAPVYSWTGLYIGIQGGYAWGDGDTVHNGLPFGNAGASGDFGIGMDNDGWLFGATIGYNWQVSPAFVLGVEADLAWADIGGSGTVLNPPLRNGAPTAPSFATATSNIDIFGTLRLRAGFLATPSFLIYATGGLAFGDVDNTGVVSYPLVVYSGANDGWQTGWTVGGGFEWMFAPRWTAKVEYLYYDLGDTSLTTNNGIPNNAPFASLFTYDNSGSILRAGVNYKF